MLIIKPFNVVYFIFIGTVFAIMGILTWQLRKKDMRMRQKVIFIIASVLAVILLVYKFTLHLDAEFVRDYPKYWGEYTIFNELPINPCNLVILFLPFAIWKKNDYLMSYCIFMGIIGASLTLMFPEQGYYGYSFYTYHIFFFYLTHAMKAALCAAVLILGIYELKYKNVFKFIVVMLIIAFVLYFVTFAIRKSGLCPFANYAFTMDTEGNPLLEFFYNIIPIEGLYLVLMVSVLCPICFLLVAIYKMIKHQ